MARGAGARANPAQGSARIELALAAREEIGVAIYDVRGARARELARREFGPGRHALAWDGRDERGGRVRAGIYFVRAASLDASGDGESTVRLVLLQ